MALMATWEWRDDKGAWKTFGAEDASMLEENYGLGTGKVFFTQDFSFNPAKQFRYEIHLGTMQQKNLTTGKVRDMRRHAPKPEPKPEPKTPPPKTPATPATPPKAVAEPKAEAKGKKWKWEWQDGSAWRPFNASDEKMLEDKHSSKGPSAKFDTTEFSFNNDKYKVDFQAGTQTNVKTSTIRNIRRQSCQHLPEDVVWEWLTDKKTWERFSATDSDMLEQAHRAEKTYDTRNLSFAKGFLYTFDFDVMCQVNRKSNTSRKIRRAGQSAKMGEKGAGYDAAFAAAILETPEDAKTAGGADEVVFDLTLPETLINAQSARGAQSLRGMVKDYGHLVSNDDHGKACFDEMLSVEQELCGQFAVFYHSYSCAALMYEVQAAVGSVLFRYKAEVGGLPRICAHGFRHIPNAKRMRQEFPKWDDMDHNPAFKAVGLCATSSLLADDLEAPPKKVFLAGYNVGNLAGVLEKLLQNCGLPEENIEETAGRILQLASSYGLDTEGVPGGQACRSGRSGHLLQIFVHRSLVDEYVYPSQPYGIPIQERLPLSKYLAESPTVDGQVRITLNPDVFLRARYSRMFTYSADPTYHDNRKEFIQELVQLLNPILDSKAARVKAAKGIFGGKIPTWWSEEDQTEHAWIPKERMKKADMELKDIAF